MREVIVRVGAAYENYVKNQRIGIHKTCRVVYSANAARRTGKDIWRLSNVWVGLGVRPLAYRSCPQTDPASCRRIP